MDLFSRIVRARTGSSASSGGSGGGRPPPRATELPEDVSERSEEEETSDEEQDASIDFGGGADLGSEPRGGYGENAEKGYIDDDDWSRRLEDAGPVPKEYLTRLVLHYLVTSGRTAAAKALCREASLRAPVDLETVELRAQIETALHAGRVAEAMALLASHDPNFLRARPQLDFLVKRQRFLEILRPAVVSAPPPGASADLGPSGAFIGGGGGAEGAPQGGGGGGGGDRLDTERSYDSATGSAAGSAYESAYESASESDPMMPPTDTHTAGAAEPAAGLATGLASGLESASSANGVGNGTTDASCSPNGSPRRPGGGATAEPLADEPSLPVSPPPVWAAAPAEEPPDPTDMAADTGAAAETAAAGATGGGSPAGARGAGPSSGSGVEEEVGVKEEAADVLVGRALEYARSELVPLAAQWPEALLAPLEEAAALLTAPSPAPGSAAAPLLELGQRRIVAEAVTKELLSSLRLDEAPSIPGLLGELDLIQKRVSQTVDFPQVPVATHAGE